MRRYAVTVFMLLIGASVFAVPDSPPRSVDAARELWKSQRVANYAVDQLRLCECPEPYTIRIVVLNGKISQKLDPRNGRPFPNNEKHDLSWPMTIDELFAFLQKAEARKPHKSEITFDAKYGYPTRISIDFDEMMADEEFIMELSNFHVRADDER